MLGARNPDNKRVKRASLDEVSTGVWAESAFKEDRRIGEHSRDLWMDGGFAR